MQRELRELYQLEVEAAGCYEKLGDCERLNKALEAKVVDACGEDEYEALTKQVAVENRKRRLESISAATSA